MSVPRDETLDRTEFFSCVCRLGALPFPWTKEGCPEGYPGHRMVIKGRLFGADWEGRIDLWSVLPVCLQEGDKVRVKVLRAVKRVARLSKTHYTRSHGPVEKSWQVDLGADGAEEEEEEREYWRIESCPEAAKGSGQLEWRETKEEEDPAAIGKKILFCRNVRGRQRNGQKGKWGSLLILEDVQNRIKRVGEEIEDEE